MGGKSPIVSKVKFHGNPEDYDSEKCMILKNYIPITKDMNV